MGVLNQDPSLSGLFKDLRGRVDSLEQSKRFTAPFVTAHPTNPQQGDVWVRSDLSKVYSYINSTIVELSTGSSAGSIPSGTLTMFGGSTVPTDWLLCDGRSTGISRTTYSALFAVIGTTYGAGDGSTTFNLPDFRSRIPIGAGTGTGLTTRTLGTTGGAESVTIASGNLPTHQHTITHGHANTFAVSGGNTGINSVNHTHTFTSGTVSANHTHDQGTHGHSYKTAATATSGTTRAIITNSGTGATTGGINDTSPGATGTISANHNHAGTTDGINQNHDHTFTPSISGGVTNNTTDSTGNGGFANTALAMMNPWLAVSFIIKT